jgi:hypothetical protein
MQPKLQTKTTLSPVILCICNHNVCPINLSHLGIFIASPAPSLHMLSRDNAPFPSGTPCQNEGSR